MATKTPTGLTAASDANVDDTAVLVGDDKNAATRKFTLAQIRTKLNTNSGAVGRPPLVLHTAHGLSTTSNGVEVSLGSYALPANVLSANGQQIRVRICGRAQTVDARMQVKFGATNLCPSVFDLDDGDSFVFEATIVRTGAATQVATFSLVYVAAGGAFSSRTERTAPTETLSGAVTIDFRGQCQGAGQLNFESISVEHIST